MLIRRRATYWTLNLHFVSSSHAASPGAADVGGGCRSADVGGGCRPADVGGGCRPADAGVAVDQLTQGWL